MLRRKNIFVIREINKAIEEANASMTNITMGVEQVTQGAQGTLIF